MPPFARRTKPILALLRGSFLRRAPFRRHRLGRRRVMSFVPCTDGLFRRLRAPSALDDLEQRVLVDRGEVDEDHRVALVVRRQIEHVRRGLQQDLSVGEIAADREPTFRFGAQASQEFAVDANRRRPVARIALDAGKTLGDFDRRGEVALRGALWFRCHVRCYQNGKYGDLQYDTLRRAHERDRSSTSMPRAAKADFSCSRLANQRFGASDAVSWSASANKSSLAPGLATRS